MTRDGGDQLEPAQDEAGPLISIGLPVYNGEAFLADAIESILAQTFDDFELIISDNASTDATPRICETYAQRDSRVRYFRQERNLGAAPNYNFTFYKSRGKYFKWSAHDDIMEPTWLEECVLVLEADPEVGLAFPRTVRIDASGIVRGNYPDYSKMRLGSSRPSERFGDMISKTHNCVAVFGLMRREELAKTALHAAHEGGDRHLLAEMALRGPLHEVPEYLFKRRDHAGAYSSSSSSSDRTSWWDTSRVDTITFPEWRSLHFYLGLINESSLPSQEKWACRRQLIRWMFGPRWYRQRWVKLLRDLVKGGYRFVRKAVANRRRSL